MDAQDEATRRTVVVGITGPGREQAALRFADAYAHRTGSEMLVVHAVHAGPPSPPAGMLLTEDDALAVGSWVVKEVSEELELMTGGTARFRGLAIAGTPQRVLGDLSHRAGLVVLQQPGGHGLARVFTGSTAAGVAARAECPVVSVPPDWHPDDAGGEVVVGVHEGGGPREVLEAGFEWASGTGSPLRIVHAWRLDGAYDDIITARTAGDWRTAQEEAIDAAAADLRQRSPEVPVVVEVRHQWAADVLVDDSRVATMVVVGRHGSRPWALQHVGSVARSVLRLASSPVMVVPVHPPRFEDWDLTADEVSPQT